MSQPTPRSKPPVPPHSPPTRRLQTPQERFGTPPVGAPEAAPELFLVGDTTPSANHEVAGHEVDANDPFAPYVRPKLHTMHHSPRRHELKHHEVRPHEVKRHEVKRLGRERHDPVGQAARGPLLANGTPVRKTQTQKKAKKFLSRFLGMALVLFVGYCGIATLSAPQFAVKSVQLEGLRDTPRPQVDAFAQKLIGQNFFRANRNAVERSVETLPTVASAHVVQAAGWPPRLKLVVAERQPTLRVGAGTKWWVVDQNGMPYRAATAQDANLYALTAPQFEPQTGKVLPSKWWSRAVELEKALDTDNALASANVANAHNGTTEAVTSANAPFWQLRRLYFDRHGMASVRVSGQGPLRQHNEMLIRLGESDWAPKLARARVALAYFERTGRNAQELDLVSYTYPTWRASGSDTSQNPEQARFGMISTGSTVPTTPSSATHNG